MSPVRGFRFAPDDLLFFRDGKPSTQGDDHDLESIFPPSPATLYGALRARRLFDAEIAVGELSKATWPELLSADLVQELGPWGGFGTMRLRGPWLVRDGNQVLLPAPGDVAVLTERTSDGPKVSSVFRLRLDDGQSTARWSHPLGAWRPFERRNEGWIDASARSPVSAAGEWWITAAGLTAWAAGGVPAAAELVHRSELWQPEPRVGVGLATDDRLAQEHLLFTFGFVRLSRNVELGFELEGSPLAAELGLRLGGEGRTGQLRPGPTFPAAPPIPQGARRIVVSTLTPMLSLTGAFPPGFAPSRLSGKFGGLDAALAGALVRSWQPLGGWDLVRRRAKPLRRAIPPGSVFALESSNPSAAVSLWGTNHSDFAEEGLSQQGFGLVACGVYPT